MVFDAIILSANLACLSLFNSPKFNQEEMKNSFRTILSFFLLFILTTSCDRQRRDVELA